jgi:hypothetical protein
MILLFDGPSLDVPLNQWAFGILRGDERSGVELIEAGESNEHSQVAKRVTEETTTKASS